VSATARLCGGGGQNTPPVSSRIGRGKGSVSVGPIVMVDRLIKGVHHDGPGGECTVSATSHHSVAEREGVQSRRCKCHAMREK